VLTEQFVVVVSILISLRAPTTFSQCHRNPWKSPSVNTLRTGDADLCF